MNADCIANEGLTKAVYRAVWRNNNPADKAHIAKIKGRMISGDMRFPRRDETGSPAMTPGRMTRVKAISWRPISPDKMKPVTVITTPILKKAASVARTVRGSPSL